MTESPFFKKTVRPGSIDYDKNNTVSVYVFIEYTARDGTAVLDVLIPPAGKLSLSGVEGPLANGDARGSCGQINMGYAHRDPAHNDRRYSEPKSLTSYEAGWDRESWLKLLDIWREWHLNDMKPNCEHQVGPEWDTRKELTIYSFRLSSEIVKQRRAAEDRAKEALMQGKAYVPQEAETKLVNLPHAITSATEILPEDLQAFYEPNGPQYKGDHYNKPLKKETAGWVDPKEHPEGLMSKPCGVCGYKYGTKWLSTPVPEDVLAWLRALPAVQSPRGWNRG